MFEFELENEHNGEQPIPATIHSRFCDFEGQITGRTILEWGEHCTECAIPYCYSTCDFYSPRSDGKCRRFLKGISRVKEKKSLYGYLTGITFKKWGKIWSPGNIHLFSVRKARNIEFWNYTLARILRSIPFRNFKIGDRSLVSVYQNRRRAWVLNNKLTDEVPSYFLMEVYNPSEKNVELTFEIRPQGNMAHMPFLKCLSVTGFKRFKIPYEEISKIVDLTKPYDISIIPDTGSGDVTLYFGTLDYVKDGTFASLKKQKKSNKKKKALIWDLDNTLWEGILIEDGIENIELKPKVRKVLDELDQRGILLSIASKNSFDDAMLALESFGIKDLFLYPQISWAPKGQAVQKIASNLNIGIDTIAFIDDSLFERAEVAAVCPEVFCIPAEDYQELCKFEEFDVVKTGDSVRRRKYYQSKIVREESQSNFDGSYFEFLRKSKIELKISRFSESNIERVYELTQRTNQMNFSGNRYTKSQLEEILTSKDLLCLVLNASDGYGTYGVIGFSVIMKEEPRIVDLMFSCRVQSKRVEHALIAYVLSFFKEKGKSHLFADYRKTDRNKQSGKVFEDLGFEIMEEDGEVLKLVFSLHKSIPDDKIVHIEATIS